MVGEADGRAQWEVHFGPGRTVMKPDRLRDGGREAQGFHGHEPDVRVVETKHALLGAEE